MHRAVASTDKTVVDRRIGRGGKEGSNSIIGEGKEKESGCNRKKVGERE